MVSCRAAGVLMLIGDATAVEVLRKVDLQRAAYGVALCGDSGVNAHIAATVQTLARDRRTPVTCLAHVLEPSLCRLLTARYLSTVDASPFRLEFFNLYERDVQVLLARQPPFAADHPGDAAGPHLLMVASGSSVDIWCSSRRDAGGRTCRAATAGCASRWSIGRRPTRPNRYERGTLSSLTCGN